MPFLTSRQIEFNQAVASRYEEGFIRRGCDTLVSAKNTGDLASEEQHKRFKRYLNQNGEYYSGIVASVFCLNAAAPGTPVFEWAEQTLQKNVLSLYEHCLLELDRFEEAEPDLVVNYILSRLNCVPAKELRAIRLELEVTKWSCHTIADMQRDDRRVYETRAGCPHPAYSHLNRKITL